MRMKRFSPGRKPLSRARARNAALINQFATPGLGSLMCRRWISGTGQLVVMVTGFCLFLFWFVQVMGATYRTAFSEVPPALPDPRWAKAGWILVGAAWAWSGVTSFFLLREAAANEVAALKNLAAAPAAKLAPDQAAAATATVPEWQRQGDVIRRVYQFKDFPASVRFVNAVAEAAEAAWHHPDIDIRWNKVTLSLTTHDAGGLTEKDFALAKRFDDLSRR